MNDTDYLVSIRCLTFNQAAYITDAMNGFCMQETTFPFVAIIVDDASTDGEQEVIKEYLDNHFKMMSAQKWETEEADFTVVTHKMNKSCCFVVALLKKNLYHDKTKKLSLIARWEKNVKYRTGCEGDDYWTDPLKLQKQVDFLEGHEDYSMCTHAALWDRDGELFKEGCQHSEECALSTDEVIRYGGLYLATASLVFRKELADDWPDWRKLSDVGDYPLQILGTLRGGLWFFPEPMCVYRYLHSGSWTYNTIQKGLNVGHLKTEISWLTRLDEETDYQYSDAIYSHLIPFYSKLYLEKQLGFAEYYKAFKKTSVLSKKRFVKDVLINNFNWLYKLIK